MPTRPLIPSIAGVVAAIALSVPASASDGQLHTAFLAFEKAGAQAAKGLHNPGSKASPARQEAFIVALAKRDVPVLRKSIHAFRTIKPSSAAGAKARTETLAGLTDQLDAFVLITKGFELGHTPAAVADERKGGTLLGQSFMVLFKAAGLLHAVPPPTIG